MQSIDPNMYDGKMTVERKVFSNDIFWKMNWGSTGCTTMVIMGPMTVGMPVLSPISLIRRFFTTFLCYEQVIPFITKCCHNDYLL